MTETSTVLSEAFDTAGQEGTPASETLPAGHYVARITDARVGPLKSGKGQAIQLTWAIDDGALAGRFVWDRVIVTHESAKAMEFGRRKLKDICNACGFTGELRDLTVLQDKPCLIFVKVEQDDGGDYPPKNVVGRVKPIARATAKTNGGKPDFDDKIPF
jgi:hypothetical protein